MIKVGIDARKVGPYVRHLLKVLAKTKTRVKFVLFFDSRVSHQRAEKYASKNVQIKYFPFSRYRKFVSYAYSQILVSAFLAKERLSVFHAAAGTMPIVYTGKSILNIWKIEKSLPARTLQGQIIGAAKKVLVPTKQIKQQLLKTYKIKDPTKVVVSSRRPKRATLLKFYKGVVGKKNRKRKKKK